MKLNLTYNLSCNSKNKKYAIRVLKTIDKGLKIL